MDIFKNVQFQKNSINNRPLLFREPSIYIKLNPNKKILTIYGIICLLLNPI